MATVLGVITGIILLVYLVFKWSIAGIRKIEDARIEAELEASDPEGYRVERIKEERKQIKDGICCGIFSDT